MRAIRPLTDEELRNLCEQEIVSASQYGADLSEARAESMDLYLGEPMGNEVEDRSQVRTREVLDTVEWLVPSLMRVFRDAENIVEFDPTGPEDEDAALQETDAVTHIFFKKNKGFINLLSFIKDGLLQKNGVLKVWLDESAGEEQETYESINDWELGELVENNDREVEIQDYSQNEDGTHNLKILTKSSGEIRIEPCPPEEFGVSRDARSIYLDDQDFVYHRTRKTKGQLVDMGYDLKTVRDLPSSEGTDVLTRERLARRFMSDEREDYEHGDHWSMERVWLTECYIRVDRDGDGHAELVRAVLAGQDSNYASGATLLDAEEVDRQPFVTWTPVLRSHAFYGLSVADLVADLQGISTTLTRQILDSTYLATNGRTGVNERVNLEDLLTSRPGGVVRTAGTEPPQNSLFPIPNQPVPQESFQMLEKLDEMRKNRTGVGDEVGALEGNELAKINTGVAALAYDAVRSKVEMIAAMCAEIGIAPLFLRIHELLRKSGNKNLMLKMRGGWVPVRPQEWRERIDISPKVGVGVVSRERRLVALSDVLEKQMMAVQGGALNILVAPDHMYRALSDYTRELGLEESLYWMDPKEAQPPQQEPDYQAAMIQVQQGAVEAQMQKNQVEAAAIASKERMQIAQIEQKERELAAQHEVKQLEFDMNVLKTEREMSDKDSKNMLDAEIKAREQEIERVEIRMKDEQEQAKPEVEVYKAVLQAGTTLTTEQMKVLGVEDNAQQTSSMIAEAMATLTGTLKNEMRAQLMEAQEATKGPKVVERDENGLIVSIGNAPVKRDESGKVISVG